MKNFVKDFIARTHTFLVHRSDNKSLLIQQAEEYDRILEKIQRKMPDNPVLKGYKVYSQNQEDGIMEAIFQRIPHAATFMEIGIQDGTECNTLNLLLNRWKGVWIEGDDEQFKKIDTVLGGHSFQDKLSVVREFVDVENISALYKRAAQFLGVTEIDFFSLDIDGNDHYVADSLLKNGHRPSVICVEYNSKFPPPMKVKIKYNAKHVWDRTEYQGASLQAFADLFAGYQYTLICCDVTGINAFFVRNDLLAPFTVYGVNDLYQPARYHLSPFITGHPASLHFLKDLLYR